jgi:cobalt/nickel transport system ATP-binding protein
MLTISDLTVEYADGTRAIESVSFSITPGESVALIGANGAGKTTLLLALVGVLLPKTGVIRLSDASADSADAQSVIISARTSKDTLREVRSRIGVVFQNPDDQLFMPSIYEDVAFGPRSFGCDEAEANRRVHTALSQLGIDHLAERSPLKLSGGEKRLAAIATVLSMKPEYLLFDEPTAYLDPRAKRNLAAVISELPQGKMIATHDLAFAEKVCSRVLLLQNGKLAEDGALNILREEATLEAAGL